MTLGKIQDPWEGIPLRPPGSLPISSVWNKLVQTIMDHQVVIVVGETGSGKTTQIPKALVLSGKGRKRRIVCTQPRRVAAISVAERVREELGEKGKELCGYRVRFRSRVLPRTRIHFVTDGLLLSELRVDPSLSRYDAVIVDEAHERSLNIDFLLGALRTILSKRGDLKLVITSATLNVDVFKKAFSHAPVFKIEGRQYPVEVIYRDEDMEGEKDLDLTEKVLLAILELKAKGEEGDTLVFLPTERSILECLKALESRLKGDYVILPLYSRLGARYQRRVFQRYNKPKIILSTNVAETSITIPGIQYVIDSGLARISRFNVRTRTRSLPVTAISRASADQRAGRAGRTQGGVAIRLYPEEEYLSFEEHTPPEIKRSNLDDVILRMLDMGIGDPRGFPFVEPPNPKAISEGLRTLRELGAISRDGRILELGRIMAKLPLEPRIARMVIEGHKRGSLREVCIIASALSIQDPREASIDGKRVAKRPATFEDPVSDFVSLIRIWNAYKDVPGQKSERRRFCKRYGLSFQRMEEWRDVYAELKDILREHGYSFEARGQAHFDAIHKAILSGFLANIAVKTSEGHYQGIHGREIHIFPGSPLARKRPGWIVSAELLKTSRLFARTVAAVEPAWIEEVGGSFLSRHYGEPHWEKQRGAVMVLERVTLWGLPVDQGRKVPLDKIDPQKARDIFIREGLSTGELGLNMPFVRHNRDCLKEAMELEERIRDPAMLQDPEVLRAFFERAISTIEQENFKGKPITNERSLQRALKNRGNDTILMLNKAMLLKRAPTPEELSLFPGGLEVDGHRLELVYRFCPGHDEDGVTVRIPASILPVLPWEPFEWLVPGMLEEKVEMLVRYLPKSVRKAFVPVDKAVKDILKGPLERSAPLRSWLSKRAYGLFGIRIPYSTWVPEERLPGHLRFRFEVVDLNGKILAKGRDLERLKGDLKAGKTSVPMLEAFKRVKEDLERPVQNIMDLDGLGGPVYPKEQGIAGIALWIGLRDEGQKGLWMRVFLNPRDANEATRNGIKALLFRELKKELNQIKKRVTLKKVPDEFLLRFGGKEAVREKILLFMKENLFWRQDAPLTRDEILERLSYLRSSLYKDALSTLERLEGLFLKWESTRMEISRLFGKGRVSAGKDPHLNTFMEELHRIVPVDFHENLKADKIENAIRYLDALAIRAARCYANPMKDEKKEAGLRKYALFLQKIQGAEKTLHRPDLARLVSSFEDMLMEYRVSVFAPEVGPRFPVSEKRLRKLKERLEGEL